MDAYPVHSGSRGRASASDCCSAARGVARDGLRALDPCDFEPASGRTELWAAAGLNRIRTRA